MQKLNTQELQEIVGGVLGSCMIGERYVCRFIDGVLTLCWCTPPDATQ
jgi:bacteriocin-like protein